MSKRRWSGHDKHFGPFTYSRSKDYKPLTLVIDSDDDEGHGCHLRMGVAGHTLILELPRIIQPWRRKVVATTWDPATIKRLGRDFYYDTHHRVYGFSLNQGFLRVFLGRQTHDSVTTQDWSWFLPWTQWRHVRFSLFDTKGEHFWTQLNAKSDFSKYDIQRQKEDECPSVTFTFRDYDGEVINARAQINEREWHFGERWFKWLSWFRRPLIVRSLDLRFSKEVGPEKGSWKGGTLGHSIEMLPGELHEDAFIRYCAQNKLTYLSSSLEA